MKTFKTKEEFLAAVQALAEQSWQAHEDSAEEAAAEGQPQEPMTMEVFYEDLEYAMQIKGMEDAAG